MQLQRTTTLRCLSATLALGIWGFVWLAGSTLAPGVAVKLWTLTLVLWGFTFFEAGATVHPDRTMWWALIVILVALVPRTVWLTEAPYSITVDEVSYPLQGMDAAKQGAWAVLGGVHEDEPYVSHLGEFLQAWPCLLMEPRLGARVASVLFAIVSLVSTYALAVRLFGRVSGIVALVVLACSHWHMAYSRVGYPYMQPMALVPLTLLAVVVGTQHSNRLLQFAAGALLGVCLLTYTPAQIAILLSAVWLACHCISRRPSRREAALTIGALAIGFGVMLTPYLQQQGTGSLLLRYRSAAMGPEGPVTRLRRTGWISTDGRALLQQQLAAAARPYYVGGAAMAVGEMSSTPLLDPLSLTLATIGIAIAAMRFWKPEQLLLLTWIGAVFVLGQALTDIPASAYRGAPLLPAVAIAAGVAVSRLVEWLPRRWSGPLWVRAAAVALLIAVLVPTNLSSLRQYVRARSHSWAVSLARLIERDASETVYYLVAAFPLAHEPLFRWLGHGKELHDMPSVMDSLGTTIDTTRHALFLLEPSMVGAAAAIHRCYPGAVLWSEPSGPRDDTVLGLFVPRDAVVAGQDCRAPALGPGLWARYFMDSEWSGPLAFERVEEWPVRFHQDLAGYGSIEWSGTLQVPVPGTYQFQLWGREATGSASIGSLTVALGDIASAGLRAGALPLTIRCQPHTDTGTCWLRWAPPGGTWSALPTLSLTPAAPVNGGTR